VLLAACGPRFPPHAPVAPDLLKTICGASGAGAHVQVWRRTDDASITTLEVEPKARDGMLVFYDERGREQLQMPAHPDAPSSPEALQDDQRRDNVVEDGSRAERVPCDAPN